MRSQLPEARRHQQSLPIQPTLTDITCIHADRRQVLERLLYCISHVFSQLAGRWPGAPDFAAPAGLMLTDCRDEDVFSDPSLTDFKDLLRRILDRSPELLPWLGPWERAKDPGLDRLASAVRRHLFLLREAGAHYLTYADAAYPPLLRCIPDPPLALSVIGCTAALSQPCVSIIGSRKASALAMRESFELALQLARRGYQVVSGGAFGCDLAAHQGALAAQIDPAPTIMVAAGGLARLYPVHNHYVFDRIRSGGGTFISERLWWDGCFPRDFAVRNRIISGMSFATCVMQAAMKSGALLTAKHALEHGRHVLVLRHPEYDVRAEGSRWLEDDGATVFSSSAELALSLSGPASG